GVFHLTGGTALGRFYLHHRYSEDLDLFTNKNPEYISSVGQIREILRNQFHASDEKVILYQDFVRVWIPGKEELKVEMVNDVAERWGAPLLAGYIPIDTVGNILANKLTTLVSRDEPKDVFDIVTISSFYSFNWSNVFVYALRKAIIAEPDVAMRLTTFPVELLEGKDWLMNPVDSNDFKQKLNIVSHDFLFGNDNSLGVGKTPVEEAVPNEE
ncbi:MAG: nucleotidyl transferase AbiEii/AbiGii toxin family protein, partial [Bacteroidales bacterium]|nr:nucleotidyl transferase AbiEii/AbiGii toxin family protein [Bacteroidales bacterium]